MKQIETRTSIQTSNVCKYFVLLLFLLSVSVHSFYSPRGRIAALGIRHRVTCNSLLAPQQRISAQLQMSTFTSLPLPPLGLRSRACMLGAVTPSRHIETTTLGSFSKKHSQSALFSTYQESSSHSSSSTVSTAAVVNPDPVQRIRDRYKSASASNLQSYLPVSLVKLIWPEGNLRLRVFLVLSMIFMFVGKWMNVKVPFMLQRAVDSLSEKQLEVPLLMSLPFTAETRRLATSVGAALTLYGVCRAVAVVCAEIKTCLFAHVSQNILRQFANQIFARLHMLDSEFHLSTPSGVVSVAYVRAIRGLQTFLFQIVFSVLPAVLELGLVSRILYMKCGGVFASITLATFFSYLTFTVWITQWRVNLRQEQVDVDNARNGYFIDSVLNHETVKLFANEKRETKRFDSYLAKIQRLSIDSTYAIALLNCGQAAMFCVGLTASLLVALGRVRDGSMTVGDLVAVNSMLLQLSIPFNFMGYTYQELRQSMVDMAYMQNILLNVKSSITTTDSSPDIDTIVPRPIASSVEFRDVNFKYDKASASNLLQGVSFKILPGDDVAIVGPSGSGKSTILRLITRLLDPDSGCILLDGVDTRTVSLESMRGRLAVIPQDTSLFDESVRHNLVYGRPDATEEEIEEVLDSCCLRGMLEKMPAGLDTPVGERGARLSGGERQKVAIARALLCKPSLLLCDEVTSAVDAFSERDIIDSLKIASKGKTTITVAHRLASVAHCNKIIVVDKGQVVEVGTHSELLTRGGVYHSLWVAQTQGSHGHSPVPSAQASPVGTETISSTLESSNGTEHANGNEVSSSLAAPADSLYGLSSNHIVDDDDDYNEQPILSAADIQEDEEMEAVIELAAVDESTTTSDDLLELYAN